MWNGAWPSLEITNLQRGLSDVVSLVQSPPTDQLDEVSRALARFLVVRTCGHLEQVVDRSCVAYIQSKSSARVTTHGQSYFGRGANPSPDKLISLVRRFDVGWATDLERTFNADDHRLHREISFLVDRRNKIAHGLSESLGAAKALAFVPATSEVTKWFLATFDPR